MSWFYVTNEGHRELHTSFLPFINIVAIPDNIYNNDPNVKVDLIIFWLMRWLAWWSMEVHQIIYFHYNLLICASKVNTVFDERR